MGEARKMIAIEFPLRKWAELISPYARLDDFDTLYDLPNGMVLDQVIMPWERAGNDVIIQFRTESEATWFILSHGGQIFSG